VEAATGNTTIAGNLAINGTRFTVDGGTGNTTVSGLLTANGGVDSNNGTGLDIGKTSASVQLSKPNATTTVNGDLVVLGTITGTTKITDVTQTGNFTQNGNSTFTTGAGAVTLRGDTTVAAGKTFTVAGGTSTFTGDLTQSGGTVNLGNTTVNGTFKATSLDSTPIGQNAPAAGKFTTLDSTGKATLDSLAVTNASTLNSVGFYGKSAVPSGSRTGLPADGSGQATTTVCTDATCTGKAQVANSATVTEVDALQARVNQLETQLKAYGLLP